MGLWLTNTNSKTRRRSRRPPKVYSDPKQNPELKAAKSSRPSRPSSVFDEPNKIADELLSDPISETSGVGCCVVKEEVK